MYEATFGPYEYRGDEAAWIYQKALDVISDQMLAQLNADEEKPSDS